MCVGVPQSIMQHVQIHASRSREELIESLESAAASGGTVGASLQATAQPTIYSPGSTVLICGLLSAEGSYLNGKHGTVRSYNAETERASRAMDSVCHAL